MRDFLPLLEATASMLEAELVIHDAYKKDNGEWEFEVELVADSIEELTEALRVKMSKYNRSARMRKAKMRFGKKPKLKLRSSRLTLAQKKQRQKAAMSSGNKRRGKRASNRRLAWR